MHPEREGAVFYLVTERKLHLIPVFIFHGASFDALPVPTVLLSVQHTVKEPFYLTLLDFQLFCIRKG